jgi:GNAT superfamily N-acetyltransferase
MLREEDGLLLYSVGRPVVSAHLNGVVRLEPAIDAARVVDRARRFFAPMGREFVMWIRDPADADLEQELRRAGLSATREPGIPCMVIRRRLAGTAPPDGVELRRVANQSDAEDYARVTVTAFDLDEETACAVFAAPDGLLAPHVAAFVAAREGVPVAAALTLRSGSVAGIYYVGTVPAARGSGLGALCTRAATNAGLDLGADCVVLQASIMGEPLYRKMGFDLLGYYRWYRPPLG